MPQANIYFMALPIKIGFGAVLLLLCLPAIVKRVPVMFESALQFAASPL
jgi:flagellar biosynthesis protein FliR